jgi:transcriptional regulator with XRE-family HTH domain
MKITGSMTGKGFAAWRERMGWSYTVTARELGLSRATVANLLKLGKKPIPLLVEHACKFLEFDRTGGE